MLRIPRIDSSLTKASSNRLWNICAQRTGSPQASYSSPEASKRSVLLSLAPLLASALQFASPSLAAEQGIQPSDYTVPALSASQYADKIRKSREQAWKDLNALIEDSKYVELSNNLVLPPMDDLRQSVLYIPSALLKEGKRQEAIGSRKAYTDYLRDLKKLDELAQKANRFEADEEDVIEALARLSKRLDAVLSFVQ